jgi:putative hydrolase of the HAD superfamily
MSAELPDPSTVSTVLLDAGGVIVRPDFDRVAASLGSHGVEADADRLRQAEPRVKRELDRPPGEGRQTDEERAFLYFELLLGHAGIARSAGTDAALLELKAWHDEHCLWDEVPEGVGEALRALRRAGVPVSVVSNSNGTVRRLMERLGFLELFDVVIDSAVVGVEKPDPGIFRLALERTGARAEEAIYAGDIYSIDVVGARGAGIRPVLVDEADLYPDADCPRVRSLAELARHLLAAVQPGGDFLLDSESER